MRFILNQAGPGEKVADAGTSGIVLYIVVGDLDIDAYYPQVKERVNIVQPLEDKPWGDRVFAVADPDGYQLWFAREASA